MDEKESGEDGRDEGSVFNVTFRACEQLGLRLSASLTGRGACFDGWSGAERALGENQDKLEPGDRLIQVGQTELESDISLDDVILLIKRTSKTIRESAQKGAKHSTTKNPLQKLATGKFDRQTRNWESERLVLRFKKPSRVYNVELSENLQVWFQPATRLMLGARYVECASNASNILKQEMETVPFGALLIAMNGRAVEGVRFEVVLKMLSEASLPVSLRFAMDSGAKNFLADLTQQSALPTSQQDDESDTEDESDVEGGEGKEGDSEGLDSPKKQYARFLELERTEDPFLMATNVPYAAKHLRKFFESIVENDREYFLQRLRTGQDLSVRDDTERTPLLVACATQEENAVFFARHLIAEGVEVTDVDGLHGNTAMHIASSAGNAEVLALLKEAGGDVNAVNFAGRTPLIEAVSHGRHRCVEFLLKNRAKVDAHELKSGWTAMHYCALSGRDDITLQLLATGRINLHTRTNSSPFRESRTALEIAREAGNEQVAAILHECLAQEPLQRVWPRPSDWVVTDDGIKCADLMWRIGHRFMDYKDIEAKERQTSSNFFRKYRRLRRPGRHSKSFLEAEESKLYPQSRQKLEGKEKDDNYDDDDDEIEEGNDPVGSEDGEQNGELWIGSVESLSHVWVVERKRISEVLLLCDSPQSDDLIASNRWLDNLPCHRIYFDPQQINFAQFARTVMPKAVKVVAKALKLNRRVLVCSLSATVESVLHFPVAVCHAVLVSKFECRYKNLKRLFRQNCYFYTVEGARAKTERIQTATGADFSEEELVQEMINHGVRSREDRTQLPEEWDEGFIALDDKVHQRRLEAMRRRQAMFRATFIM